MQKVFLFGDSNALFFARSFSDWDHANRAEWEPGKTGVDRLTLDNVEATFLWKAAMPTARVNVKYLEDRVADLGSSSEHIYGSVLIFMFGRIDLQFRVRSRRDVDKIIPDYLSTVLKFAKSSGAKTTLVCSPIINTVSLADEEIINYYSQVLGHYCDSIAGTEYIDLSPFAPTNYISDLGDSGDHLNKEDSRKAMKFILSKAVEYGS